MVFVWIFLFLGSCSVLYFASQFLVSNLTKIAQFLGIREFIVAFFLMAFVATLPNFFVGLSSVINHVPELSFGDVVGGNIVDLTLSVAIATFFAKSLTAESKTVQISAIFTMFIAILPIFLILDGNLGKKDGLILIFFFFFYFFWLFSKKERFRKVYDNDRKISRNEFLNSILKIILTTFFLILASQVIVKSAIFFSKTLKVSLAIVGILIVGLGNSIPEIYFAIVAAKMGEGWMILGDLMGSVVAPATLILGLVALLSPFEITNFSAFFLSRFFLLISAILFLVFIRTGKKITKKEAFVLLIIYLAFVISEILI